MERDDLAIFTKIMTSLKSDFLSVRAFMITLLRLRLLLVMVLSSTLLYGCGSSGTSTGGGSPNQYAGTYEGTVTFTGIGRPGGTGPTSGPITFQISQNGEVSANISEGAGWETCDINGPSVFLQGNMFAMTAMGPCGNPGIARCNVVSQHTGTVSGNVITGSGTHTYDCPSGVEEFSFTANKTAA